MVYDGLCCRLINIYVNVYLDYVFVFKNKCVDDFVIYYVIKIFNRNEREIF